MGSAFVAGILRAGLVGPAQVVLADADAGRLASVARETGTRAAPDNRTAASGSDVVLVAVKPGTVIKVLTQIAPELKPGQLVISVAAGVGLEAMQAALPEGTPVIRAMPNTPCRIGAGAVGYSRGKHVSDEQAAVAHSVFSSVGIAFEVPEKLLNAVTGLSGSGPAYVFLVIEALSDAGVRVGLPRDVSLPLAAHTVAGAARMVIEGDEHPARLKDQVTSPGGTTIAGLDALERAGLRSALIEAVKAAVRRAEELG